MASLVEILTFPLVLHGALVFAMTLFIAVVLHHEIELPFGIAAPMGLFIAIFGYGVSWLSNFVIDVPMLWSLAGQGAILALIAGLYDAMT